MDQHMYPKSYKFTWGYSIIEQRRGMDTEPRYKY